MLRKKIIELLSFLLSPQQVFWVMPVKGLRKLASLKKKSKEKPQLADFSHVCTNMCHPILWNFFFLILPALWCFSLLNRIPSSKVHSKELCWQAYVSFLAWNARVRTWTNHLLLQLPLITLAEKETAVATPLCRKSHQLLPVSPFIHFWI